MSELFATGRIIDIILALVALEAVGLSLLRRRFGYGPALAPLLSNLAAGACLLLAVKAAAIGAAWPWMAAALAAAGIAHLLDVGLRWRG